MDILLGVLISPNQHPDMQATTHRALEGRSASPADSPRQTEVTLGCLERQREEGISSQGRGSVLSQKWATGLLLGSRSISTCKDEIGDKINKSQAQEVLLLLLLEEAEHPTTTGQQ